MSSLEFVHTNFLRQDMQDMTVADFAYPLANLSLSTNPDKGITLQFRILVAPLAHLIALSFLELTPLAHSVPTIGSGLVNFGLLATFSL